MAASRNIAALTFRAMTLADLDRVLEVETRAYAFPWTRGIFADCLSAGHECRVACHNGEIVGHAVLSAAAGESHLLNICIKRDAQGRGWGRLFVRHVLQRARALLSELAKAVVTPDPSLWDLLILISL